MLILAGYKTYMLGHNPEGMKLVNRRVSVMLKTRLCVRSAGGRDHAK